MGQIYERSSVYDDIKKAISHYKRSYELDESQQQLTLKSKFSYSIEDVRLTGLL